MNANIDNANNNSGPGPDAVAAQAYLPDFCAAATVFVVLLAAVLIAFVLTLAAWDPGAGFFVELSKTLLFVIWTALLGCAILCQFRARLQAAGPTAAFVWCYVILLGMTLLLAETAFQLTRIFGESAIIEDPHSTFLLRTLSIGAIVIALLMRYLYVASEWRRSIVLEAQARISALQALIRPHFLFNSMNTIASLTRSDPRQAEEAVEDLSDLLRASLSNSKELSSLKEEFEIAAIYQRIEKLRLGERLDIRWDIDALPMRARIPSLTLQPLLENAIYHGIERLEGGGTVTVTGRRAGDRLSITIENPIAPGAPKKQDGNKMALSNVRQRFELAYGSQADVDIDETAERYTVSLGFPVQHPQTDEDS
ncbi:MAG: sensor histidine kinase [Pseudomonadota bacterium]